jgi:hypothetical protein
MSINRLIVNFVYPSEDLSIAVIRLLKIGRNEANLEINKAALDQLGYRREGIINHYFLDLAAIQALPVDDLEGTAKLAEKRTKPKRFDFGH